MGSNPATVHPLRLGLLLLVLLCCTWMQSAAVEGPTEPPQAPILRIEAEMHTAKITRIATDAAGRYLATASEDKTVRIWELPGGRLLRVLRPPIGKGNEGKLHAVAMSPDAKTVACAGWTGLEWDGNFSVYFFDRSSGRMLKRITGLPASINNLAYAPDGRVLAISLGGKKGVLFYRTTDDSLLAEDRDYGADSYGASFDAKGRLVTSSYDGFLRLYDVDFHLITKAKLAEGARPYGVSLSPDGSKIAVGFENSSQVVIASGQDLKPLYAADTSGIKNVAFNAVAWSSNGQTLFAAGQYRVGEQHPIRKWDNQGQGKGVDLPAAANTIVQLLPMTSGGVAYAAADPAFGIFDAQDRRTLNLGPPLADFRDGEPAFLVSKDGSTVQFAYERSGKAPVRFSITDRLIRPADAGGALLAPRTTAAGLTFTPWKNTATVSVNGRALPLEQYELARCLAITPDEQSFLLGTVWNLRLFDREGRQLWQVPAPANVWSVNITGNGQIAVAAVADGTIRWYRMADGHELLALYPHPDRRRWTLWTHSGYYDAGPGAEALLGWHKNYKRATEADFFSIDRFRAVSYRPDVVARVLATMDEQEALRLAQAPLVAQGASSGRPQAQPPMPAPGGDGFTIKPMLYALVIGVSKYQDAGLTLPFASKDAQDLAAALQRQEGSAFRGVKLTLLTDGQATKGKIHDGLDWLDRETTSKDLGLIFLAGHGVSDKNGISYFLPADASLTQLRKTALPFSDFKNTVTALAGQSVVLLDTCRPDDRLSIASCTGGINALADDLANSGHGAVVLSAAGRNQTVRDDQARGNGAFAKALLDGFGGKTTGGSSGPVTMTMLAAHVTEEVRSLTGGAQTPLTVIPQTGHDFLIAGVPGALPVTQTGPAAALATASGPPETQQTEILRRLPPVVTVLSPQDGAGNNNTTVTVQYSVRSPSGEPVTEVLVLVDGRPLSTQRGVSVVADVSVPMDMREIRVPVPERDSEISLLARNRWATSEPATVRVAWKGSVASKTAAKPNLYVVAIGVSKYADPSLSLGLAAKDAKDLTEALQRQRGKLYEDVVVKLVTDGHATKENVLEALDWLDHQTSGKDVAVLFLAGHGVNDKSGTYYFLPHNAKTDQLRRTAVPFSDIRNAVAYLQGKALLFADTCHSGDILGTRRAVADINAVVNELASAENGAIVFASSTGKQYALENPAWGNGAFTKALVEGLTGKAAYGQGNTITVNMLDLYLSERVKALTNGEQTPTTAKPHTIQDFPVAVKLS